MASARRKENIKKVLSDEPTVHFLDKLDELKRRSNSQLAGIYSVG
jgi:hypothetical protein